MPESTDLAALSAAAADAARRDDAGAATGFLRQLLDAQVATLGPHHADLATTLNNLALMLERLGQMEDAGRCYRRAHDIALRALGPDDPQVRVSHANLTAFLATYGLPDESDGPWGELSDFAPAGTVKQAPAAAPAPPPAAASPSPAATPVTPAPATPAPWSSPGTATPPQVRTRERAPQAPVAERPAAPPPARPRPTAPPPTRARPSWFPATLVLLVLLTGIVAWMLWLRPTTSEQTAFERSSAPGVLPAAPDAPAAPAAPAAQPEPDAAAAEESAEAPPAAPAPPESRATTAPPPTGDVRVVVADVCRDLSRGGEWRCTPVSDEAATRVAIYYTRIATPRDTVVRHRWSRDGAVVRTVELKVGANNVEGYRTFSRQTMTAGDTGAWEVALVTDAGAVLDTQTFAVP